jgi:sulfur-oxidizing protein SoxX
MKNRLIAIASMAIVAASCATMVSDDERRTQAIGVMKASFKEQGQAKLDRLDQDEMQRLCSEYSANNPMPRQTAKRIEATQLVLVKYPADGMLLGDWKKGEAIAQSGVGKQYNDDPAKPSGGNCYACHQLAREELSYGTIGPSLYNFAKIRGYGPDIQKYAYGKIFNAQAYSSCSSMPRFGHSGILTPEQIKDVVALLMDPNSPVNK